MKNRYMLLFFLTFMGARAMDIDQDIFGAAALGEIFRISELIDQDPSCVNKKHDSGWTPLMSAAARGHTDAVKLLIEWSASLDETRYRDENPSRTALGLAMYNHHSSAAIVLLDAGARYDLEPHRDLFVRASEMGEVFLVSAFLRAGCPVSSEAAGSALRNSNAEVVQLLLENGAVINPDDIGQCDGLAKSKHDRYLAAFRVLMATHPAISPAEKLTIKARIGRNGFWDQAQKNALIEDLETQSQY